MDDRVNVRVRMPVLQLPKDSVVSPNPTCARMWNLTQGEGHQRLGTHTPSSTGLEPSSDPRTNRPLPRRASPAPAGLRVAPPKALGKTRRTSPQIYRVVTFSNRCQEDPATCAIGAACRSFSICPYLEGACRGKRLTCWAKDGGNNWDGRGKKGISITISTSFSASGTSRSVARNTIDVYSIIHCSLDLYVKTLTLRIRKTLKIAFLWKI